MPVHDAPFNTAPRTVPLTVNDAAAYMNCSRWTVYRLVRDGALTPLKVGSRLRFRVADLDRYMEREAATP